MRIVELPDQSSPTDTVLGIGVYDGLHLAHRRLIASITQIAQEKNLSPALLTFDPPPSVLFKKDNYRLLTSLKEKLDLLSKLKIELIFLLKFTQSVANLSSEEFIDQILVKARPRLVVVGENFRFGKDRQGDSKILQEMGPKHGFSLLQLPLLRLPSGEVLSSSLIRKMIQEGKVEEANRFLCVPFRLTFKKGANNQYQIAEEEKIIPPPGVYLTYVLPGGQYLRVDLRGDLILEGFPHEITLTFLRKEDHLS